MSSTVCERGAEQQPAQRQSAQVRRENGVEVAMRTMETEGTRGATTKAITKAAGISDLYAHIATCGDVLALMLARIRTSLQESAHGADNRASPLDQLGAFFRAYIRPANAHPGIPRLLQSDEIHRRGGLTSVPVPGRHRSDQTRGLASSRRTGWLPLLVGFVLLAAVPAWAGAQALPVGVPDIYDAAVLAHFQPVAVASLRGNPDFPALLLVNTTGEPPSALLLGFDARNGKNTWSLSSDPLVLIVVVAGQATIQGVYVDTGFAERGSASGDFTGVDQRNLPALLELLRPSTATGKRINI